MLFLPYLRPLYLTLLFFFNVPATTEIYTLSLHDALPIFGVFIFAVRTLDDATKRERHTKAVSAEDRKSTHLNSSHVSTSYAVFCLKKKKGDHTAQAKTSRWTRAWQA